MIRIRAREHGRGDTCNFWQTNVKNCHNSYESSRSDIEPPNTLRCSTYLIQRFFFGYSLIISSFWTDERKEDGNRQLISCAVTRCRFGVEQNLIAQIGLVDDDLHHYHAEWYRIQSNFSHFSVLLCDKTDTLWFVLANMAQEIWSIPLSVKCLPWNRKNEWERKLSRLSNLNCFVVDVGAFTSAKYSNYKTTAHNNKGSIHV